MRECEEAGARVGQMQLIKTTWARALVYSPEGMCGHSLCEGVLSI